MINNKKLIICKFCKARYEPKKRTIGHYWGASTTIACVHKELSENQCPRCWRGDSDKGV